MSKSTAVTPVVLGLLASGPRSGYDIKTTVDRSTRFFWAASYGQIYPELRRLENDGLVEGEDVPSGRPRAGASTRSLRPGARRSSSGCSARGRRSSSATSRCCGSSSRTRCRASRRSAARGPQARPRAVPGGPARDRGAARRGPAVRRPRPALGDRVQRVGSTWCEEQLERLEGRDEGGLSRADLPRRPDDGAARVPARGLPAARRLLRGPPAGRARGRDRRVGRRLSC